ncbi:P2Y purinoceptor 2-like [Hemicordylus capensis]|uniref:P2Y purinoceptor 2-like n=1 Tax=Hemicordylus capensis TaxID=884348 RepID=UPI00230392D3|nr:P2Y purinoceptor 2-like [Hemicordylus capensis]XP_053137585.1 P2Y purinoceptor 2-like [Hemicordylus capensis]
MNTTNATRCQPQELHPAIPTFLAILSLGGLIFNSISLWIFWSVIKRWNSGIFLQFNLALVDAVVLPVTPLMVAYFSLGSHWPFGEFPCQLQVFLLSTHLYGSIYFLMLISIHRYQATVHYSIKSLWRQKSFLKKVVLAFWVILFLQGLPVFFFFKTSTIDSTVLCLSIHQSELSSLYLIYSIILGLLCFLLPFGISMTSYVMLGRYISQISQANLRGRLVKTKSIQMITIALVIFAVCFVPLHICGSMAAIVRYYNMSCEHLHHVEIIYYVSLVFTMVNCCLDPFIYNFANEKFNKAFSHALRRPWFSK